MLPCLSIMPWNYTKGMVKFPPCILDICASRKCGQCNVPTILVSKKLLLLQFCRPIDQSGRGGKEKNSYTWMTLNPGHPVRKQSCYCYILSFEWFLGARILCADVSEHSFCSIFISGVSLHHLWRWNWQSFSKHTTYEDETDSVPKRRHTKCRRRGIIQKRE